MKPKQNCSRLAILPPTMALSESDYAFTIIRIAVSQVCNSIGFTGAENPAIQALTDIATRFLRSIAKSAADSANSRGRTQSNVVDTIAAVTELSSVAGFIGAWRATGSLLESGVIKELNKFCKYSDEMPFAKPLPRKIFAIRKGKDLRNVDSSECIGGKRKHIPKWLPAWPIKEEEERAERAEGKELWEFRAESGTTLKWEEKKSDRKRAELPPLWKRGKVRFKIGKSVFSDTRADQDTTVTPSSEYPTTKPLALALVERAHYSYLLNCDKIL